MFASLIKSFKYAIGGLVHCVRHERNFRAHLSAAVLIYAISPYYRFSNAEMLLVTVVMALVIITEMINTSIERAINMITSDYHPLAKVIKDVAAASVLVSSMVAVACGAFMFLRKDALEDLFRDVAASPAKIAAAVIMPVVLIIFIGGGFGKRGANDGKKYDKQ